MKDYRIRNKQILLLAFDKANHFKVPEVRAAYCYALEMLESCLMLSRETMVKDIDLKNQYMVDHLLNQFFIFDPKNTRIHLDPVFYNYYLDYLIDRVDPLTLSVNDIAMRAYKSWLNCFQKTGLESIPVYVIEFIESLPESEEEFKGEVFMYLNEYLRDEMFSIEEFDYYLIDERTPLE